MNNDLSARVKRIKDELSGLKTNAKYTTSGLSRVVTTTGSWSGNVTPPNPDTYRNVCLSVKFTPDLKISYLNPEQCGWSLTCKGEAERGISCGWRD